VLPIGSVTSVFRSYGPLIVKILEAGTRVSPGHPVPAAPDYNILEAEPYYVPSYFSNRQ